MSRIEQLSDGVTLYLGDCREILPTLGIGIEIEPKYFDIACRRIDTELRNPQMFVEPAPVAPPKQETFL